MDKTPVKYIKCSKEDCSANSLLYYCPYCDNGHEVAFCEVHLKEHLNKHAFEGLELEEGCCIVNTSKMYGVLEQ